MADGKQKRDIRKKRGFQRASSLLGDRIRSASETRGFAVSRLLTHWDDIVGPDLAGQARPVEVNYGRGFGATLTLLTSGAVAPMVEMQKENIRERVNACYGYAAIQRIRLTQTSAAGFAEPSASFTPQKKSTSSDVTEELKNLAEQTAAPIHDEGLRTALENLGGNVLTHSRKT
ncbi:MAG: DUF721 domain-containing protein [Boseongicola sp.]|nr:MAG: DUF721 domain-containing protein [Boseongicola sp.]